jgi:hypothetical protein
LIFAWLPPFFAVSVGSSSEFYFFEFFSSVFRPLDDRFREEAFDLLVAGLLDEADFDLPSWSQNPSYISPPFSLLFQFVFFT